MRSARTSRMRAFVCEVSVTIPACEPVSEIASWPRSLITIAASAHEIRSPVESSMSISRGCGRSETSWAIATSSSVVFPRAERTATTPLPASFAATIRPAARLMRSASATEVPPNFMTTVSARRGRIPSGRCGAGSISRPSARPRSRSSPARHRGGDPGLPERRTGPRALATARGRRRRRGTPRAHLVPRAADPAAARAVEGPSAPSSIADLAQRLPLERKVAQLFLVGFEGQDLTAPICTQMRRQDLGGRRVREPQLPRPAADRVHGRRGP